MKTLLTVLFSILFLTGCGEKIVYISPQEAIQNQEKELASEEKSYFQYVSHRLPFNTELIKAIGNYWYIVKLNDEYFYARHEYHEVVLCPCKYNPETK